MNDTYDHIEPVVDKAIDPFKKVSNKFRNKPHQTYTYQDNDTISMIKLVQTDAGCRFQLVTCGHNSVGFIYPSLRSISIHSAQEDCDHFLYLRW